MIHADCSIARIRAYLKDSGVSKSALAERAGIYEACIRKVLTSEWNPTIDTLRKIEGAIPTEFVSGEQSNKSNKVKTKRKK